MRSRWSGVAVLLTCALIGCAPDPPPPSGSTATSVVTPEVRPSPASSPSPSRRAPSKAEDAADLKRALIGHADLGKPWTQPKSVSRVKGKKGEICPGHVSVAEKIAVTARAGVDLTEGGGAGRNIASFSLSTLADDEGSTLVAAYAKDQTACARYRDGNDLFVLRSSEGPASVAGTELVSSWAERIYYDKAHRKLGYVRHTLVAREGRVVTYLSYAFLTTSKDSGGKDFGRASRLLEAQLDKNNRVFS